MQVDEKGPHLHTSNKAAWKDGEVVFDQVAKTHRQKGFGRIVFVSHNRHNIEWCSPFAHQNRPTPHQSSHAPEHEPTRALSQTLFVVRFSKISRFRCTRFHFIFASAAVFYVEKRSPKGQILKATTIAWNWLAQWPLGFRAPKDL